MRAKKLLLASIGLMCINTSIQGEQWGRVKCLSECTGALCADAAKMELCQTNCGHHESSILDACKAAKTALPPRVQGNSRPAVRGLPKQPAQPASKGDAVRSQLDSETAGKETTPELKNPTAPKAESQPTSPKRPQNPPPQVQKPLPARHAGTGGKIATAEQIKALNEGKGVKVKHMKEKLEGLENLVEVLQKRINLMEPLVDNLQGVQETLKKLQQNTGFDKPEIRNNPEHDIDYKPEQFSAASSASSTLDGTSCQAVLTKIQQKIKETKDKAKSKKISGFEAQLTEMCKRTKDLARTPDKKVSDAEEVNKVFAEAKKLF